MLRASSKMRLHAIVLAVVLGGLCLEGCSSKQESSFQYLSQAREYLKKGQDSAAMIELKNAIQKDPGNGEARYLMAVIHDDRGEGAAAEIELDKARKLGVNKKKIDAALSQALLLQGKYQKLLDNLKPSSGLEAQLAASLYAARGNAYLGLEKLDKARAAFEKALKEDPGNSAAHLGLARLAVSNKDLKKALLQTEAALSKSPKNTEAWTMKGDVLRMQNKADAARAAYARVIEIDKNNIYARLHLASMDVAAGKLDAANSEVNEAEKIAPKSLQVKFSRALLDSARGKYAAARDVLQQVLRSASDYMPGVLLSGVISYELGSYEKAHRDLSRFLFQFPDNVYATKFLVATDLRLNHAADVTKDIQRLIAQAPADPQAMALVGQVYMRTRDYEKATQYLERAARLEPKNAQLRTELGASRLSVGDRQRAIEDLRSAVKLDTSRFNADALLVVTFLVNKEYDKALGAAGDWQKRQPDNPIIYNLEGGAYLGKGDVVAARKSFEAALEKQRSYFPAAMNLARLDLRDKDFTAAKRRFEDILKADKSNLNALLALGGLADATGEGSAAVTWLQKAIKAHPRAIRPRQGLVQYYLRHHEPEKALAVARNAQAAYPTSPAALLLLGGTQVAVGEGKGALATYAKLADMERKSPQLQFKLAQVQAATSHVADAQSSLEKALALKPDYLGAKVALATLRARSGHYDEALKMARDINKHLPKSSIGLSLEGNILMMQKHYLEAAHAYQQAYDKTGNSALAGEIHDAYVLAGERHKGQEVLLRRLKRHPRDVGTRLYLAQSYTNEGKNSLAIAQYRAVLKRHPANVPAMNNLAWLYLQEKDPRALEVAEKAYKLNPQSPDAADTLGWALVGKGHVKRGLDILKKAVSLAHGNPSVSYHYAFALAKTGAKTKARQQLKKLLASGRQFPEKGDAEKLLNQL